MQHHLHRRSHRDIRGGGLRIGQRKAVLAEPVEVERDRIAYPLLSGLADHRLRELSVQNRQYLSVLSTQ